MKLIPKSISVLLALGAFSCESVIGEQNFSQDVDPTSSANIQGKLVDRCCQVGRDRAVESQKFNCKLSAREALLAPTNGLHQTSRAQLFFISAAESLISRDSSFVDQCEMVLESCCLAHHRNRNCDSGKQFAKSGAACMDVELSKEVTVATESFNDCCMSCSLGILAARSPQQNESTALNQQTLANRCKLISPLASSLSGQLYEQTYAECCQENLPRISSTLLEPGTQIDCNQANGCSQRCLQTGSLDPNTRSLVEQDRCDCFTGYKLASDGVSCLDIDECKLNLHTCHKSEVCDNTRGSFRCLARSLVNNDNNQRLHSQHQHHNIVSASLSSSPRSSSLASTPAEASIANERDQIGGLLSGAEQTGEPFLSLRLCPPGARWLAHENRCQQLQNESVQRSARYYSLSRRTL